MPSPDKLVWQQRYLEHFAQNTPVKPSTEHGYWSLTKLVQDFQFNLDDHPFVIKILLENVMRHAVDEGAEYDVIDDQTGSAKALLHNRQREMQRNQERYQVLKWAQGSFNNLTVVPPGRGICH